jgi:hypothetical protein
MEKEKPGYDDTPIIPGSNYRVHDKERPYPQVISPGTASTQEQVGKTPSDAKVLFDGRDISGWIHLDGRPAEWKVENGYMEVMAKTGNIKSKQEFGDCQMHIEWAVPEKAEGESQGRGNSGVFMMEIYEIQVLDSYNNITYADGSAASIYGQYPPMANACRKPGEWQSYDVVWIAPRFEGERLISQAVITLFHNGILVHHCRKLIGPTTHRQVLVYKPHPLSGPLMLQDHGHPVRYRNIWYRTLSNF